MTKAAICGGFLLFCKNVITDHYMLFLPENDSIWQDP
jgi:hypothetical protein